MLPNLPSARAIYQLLQPDREQLFFRHLPEAQSAVPLSDHLSELIDLWLLNKEEVFSADWGTVYPPPHLQKAAFPGGVEEERI